jgi:glyoxylase-like metal-dependent hydrolase (beta-lactamase superfamily II)
VTGVPGAAATGSGAAAGGSAGAGPSGSGAAASDAATTTTGPSGSGAAASDAAATTTGPSGSGAAASDAAATTGSSSPFANLGPPPGWVPPPGMAAGEVVEVAPGLRRIVAPNPGLMTGPGTNTYLIGDGPVAVVDPGPKDDAHLAAICAAATDGVRWILVTHTHMDHAPLAAQLKAVTGAEVLAFGRAPERQFPGLDSHDNDFAPDRLLGDGDSVDVGELRVAAVFTPGHTSNHLCFEITGTGLLFSGDHVMSGSTVVIGPPDGDMTQYLESLELIRRRELRRIAPGHGPMIDDPAAVLDDYLVHRRERERQVLAALPSALADPAGITTEQIVKQLYVDVPERLYPVARFSVWAHLRKLADEGRARTAEADDIAAPWFAVG